MEDKALSDIELMQLQIKGLEIKCDLLREQQARTLQKIEKTQNDQVIFKHFVFDRIDEHSNELKELNLLLQRIEILWETVMKPTQT